MATRLPSMLTTRQQVYGYSMAIFAAIGFSGKAILIKLAYVMPVDAVTLLTLRMLFAAPFFLVAALYHVQHKANSSLAYRDCLLIVALGILGYYLSSLFDFIGLHYISAGLERLILFLYPTMVVLLSAIFLQKPFGRKEIIALVLSYAGIAVVFEHELALANENIIVGASFVFISTLTYAAYLIGTGEIVVRVGASRFTAYAMLIASVAVVVHFLLTHSVQALLLPVRVYELSFYMAIFSTVLPVFLLSASIRLIGSSHTSLIGLLGPVSTLILAQMFLGEQLSLQQMLGAALVVLGVMSLSLK